MYNNKSNPMKVKNRTKSKKRKASKKPAKKPESIIINRPEWNSFTNDVEKYKLSQSDLVQRKISLMSKHREEAKEGWLNRQEKLKKGVVDEETETVYKTAREAKDLIKHPHNKKVPIMFSTLKSTCGGEKGNESSLGESVHSPSRSKVLSSYSTVLNENAKSKSPIPRRGLITKKKQEKDAKGGDENTMKEIENVLHNTRKFIKKMDKCKCCKSRSNNPGLALRSLEGFPETCKECKAREFEFVEANKHVKRKSYNDRTLSEQVEMSKELPLGDNNDEMKPYFKSLDRIEETIKFLENNIMKDSAPSDIKGRGNPFIDPILKKGESLRNNTRSSLCEDSEKKTREDLCSLKEEALNSESAKKSEKENENRRIKGKVTENEAESETEKESSGNSSPAYAPRRSAHSESGDKLAEDQELSFDLTNKSGEKSLLKSSYARRGFQSSEAGKRDLKALLSKVDDEFQDWERNTEIKRISADDFFKENSMNMGNIQEEKSKKTDIFSNSVLKKNVKIAEAVEFDGVSPDNDDLNLERIREMLQNTKKELHNLSQINFDFPSANISREEYNREIDVMTLKKKQPIQMTATPSLPMNISLNDKYKMESSSASVFLGGKSVNLESKIPRHIIGANNQEIKYKGIDGRRVLEDEDDAVLEPRTLKVTKCEIRQNVYNFNDKYTPKSESLNIRNFLK